eukprot:7140355-Pyramimonas_sp.AAC.1
MYPLSTVGRYRTQWDGTEHSGTVQYTVGRYSTQWDGTVRSGTVQYAVGRYSTQWDGTSDDMRRRLRAPTLND